jgi:hypothetical protein
MRFPLTFRRVKPAVPGFITLGADVDPNGAGLKPGPNVDNVLYSRFSNSAGWPAHRLAVAYKYDGVGVPVAMPATIHLYDAATERWYSLEAAKPLVNNTVVFFDVIALLDGPQTAGQLNAPSQGSIEAFLLVPDPGAPAGDHYFSVGADLSLY